MNVTSIGSHSISHVQYFLTFEIFNFNLHNLLVDSGSSLNLMSYSSFQKINVVPEKITTRIIQLDRSDVIVMGELKDVMIRLAIDPRVH
jgi:hypothetical protein